MRDKLSFRERRRILRAAKEADYNKRETIRKINVPGQTFYGESIIRKVLEQHNLGFVIHKKGANNGRTLSQSSLEEIRADYERYNGDLVRAARKGRFSISTYQTQWEKMGLTEKLKDTHGWGDTEYRSRDDRRANY